MSRTPTRAVLEITLPRTQKHCYKLEKLEMRVSLKSKILPKLQHLSNVMGPSAGILTEEGSPELPAAVVTKYHRQGDFAATEMHPLTGPEAGT